MKLISGGVTAPKGFSATGCHIGIKKAKKDLALVLSDLPAVAAAAFTTNVVKAAPVLWCQDSLAKGSKIKGIIINSGNANACTGEQGKKDTEAMASLFAGCLKDVEAEQILVCSTGIIGRPMPMDVVKSGIDIAYPLLGNTLGDGDLAAEAIMTTDTFCKQIAVSIEIEGKTVTIGGMAKGSGMIHPNMATMLSFVTTDACITPDLLDKALKQSVSGSYNMISVDGDTSTNDTVIVLANGQAENTAISTEDDNYRLFLDALHFVNTKLAKDIVMDGEGATKFIEAKVIGAQTNDDARLMAKSIISSNLLKAALFGNDANWGRALCAMGYSGAKFSPENVTMHFASSAGQVMTLDSGTPVMFDEEEALKILKEREISINIELTEGEGRATAWGCDLTYEYVKINGDYRS